MIFGKIDYLNLLPFHFYLKSASLPNAFKAAAKWHSGTPSAMTRALVRGRVDAAVISSVEANRKALRTLPLGICANGAVKSVLLRKNSPARADPASRSSNALREILGLRGEVLIGDRALRAYLREGGAAFEDLAQKWRERYGLPFVFGLFACRRGGGRGHKFEFDGGDCGRNGAGGADSDLGADGDLGAGGNGGVNGAGGGFFARLVRRFNATRVKIPRYVLADYARKRGISEAEILWYLQFIYYRVGEKESRALKLFWRLVREKHIAKLR